MLRAAGWTIADYRPGAERFLSPHALREFPTENGPADYALVVDGKVLGIVEAKKLTLGPQNVVTQAERYSVEGRRVADSRTGSRGTSA